MASRADRWGLQALHGHGLELSDRAIVGALRRVGQAAQPVVAHLLAGIRASPQVWADETGLRQDDINGSLWSFGTPTARYYVRDSRQEEMVDQVLGPTFTGVLSSDFYAAFDHSAGPHQRCWAHLLREVHTLRERYAHDATLRDWAAQVHGVYTRARRFQSGARGHP